MLSSDQNNPPVRTVSQAVTEFVEDYFSNLGQEKPGNLYLDVLTLLEKPLFELVMKQCRYNQTTASTMLGLSRGTTIKKLKQYGLVKITPRPTQKPSSSKSHIGESETLNR